MDGSLIAGLLRRLPGRLATYLRRHHLALLALFIELGGVSYAAVKLPARSVGTRELKDRAVTLKKLDAVTNYSVVLTMDCEGREVTVRVYDGAHGINDLHRHTRLGGKQTAETFHRGTLGEGMRAAIEACVHGYDEMIQAWHR